MFCTAPIAFYQHIAAIPSRPQGRRPKLGHEGKLKFTPRFNLVTVTLQKVETSGL